MANRNIHQVADFAQLKTIVNSNMTVIIGFVCSSTSKKDRVMIRKFLKSKSKKFPMIHFVYMILTDEQIQQTRLGLIAKDYNDYPLVYHIRGGNNISCKIAGATVEDVYESFGQLEPYYLRDMELYEEARAKQAKYNQQNQQDSNNESDQYSDSEIETVNTPVENHKTAKTAKIQSPNQIISNSQNSQNTHSNPAEIELTPEQKAALIREQMGQIEISYAKAQKELLHEIRDRIKLEKKLAKQHKAEKEKSKDDRHDGRDGRDRHRSESNTHRRAVGSNTKPQHDQIGDSSPRKQRNNRRSGRRR